MKAEVLDLEDWMDLRGLFLCFVKTGHSSKLDLSFETMRAYFVASIANPMLYAIIGVRDSVGQLVGFAIVYEIGIPGAAIAGRIPLRPTCFILAAYVEKNRRATKVLSQAVDDWARARGHTEILGNCRMTIPARACALYGYREKYKVMSKELSCDG